MSKDPILNELRRLRIEFEGMIKKNEAETAKRRTSMNMGLSKRQIRSWLTSEPDFTKRIVTPLDSNRRQTRRYQNQTSQCLNEPLNACDRNRNQEPL